MKNEIENPSPFFGIGTKFTMNMHGLYVLNNRIGTMADEYDKKHSSAFMETMETWKKKASESGVIKMEINGDGKEVIALENSIVDPNSNYLKELTQCCKALSKAAPNQKELLQKGALMLITTYYESLIADIFNLYYRKNPGAIPGENRNISLSELLKLGKIDSAIGMVIEKEISSFLRESLTRQVSIFKERHKIDFNAMLSIVNNCIEVDQRRNIHVHNMGIANATYIDNVDPGLVTQHKVSIGEKLDLSLDYLNNSIGSFQNFGILILLSLWNKWDKETTTTAESFLLDYTYEMLGDTKHEVVKQLFSVTRKWKFQSDRTKRMLAMNYCIACRDSGDSKQIKEVLDEFDWSSVSPVFIVAKCAVMGDIMGVADSIPKAVAIGELNRDKFENWPLFNGIRDEVVVRDVCAKCGLV